jgi:acyl-CoA thioester hydrolase
MPNFRFYHPVEVRYGDLDPQGHVNNARYLTYMEQARVEYIRHLGLWDGKSFVNIGFILADAQITFRQPIFFEQPVRVGVRVSSLGNKSIKMEYRLEDAQNSHLLATGSTVLVTYNYQAGCTIPVPEQWREAITTFEEMSPGAENAASQPLSKDYPHG